MRHLAVLPLLLGATSARAADPHYTVIISDLHLGGDPPSGGDTHHAFEDYRWTADMQAFLEHLDARSHDLNAPVDLVIAGDMLELWQSAAVSCAPANPALGCSEVEATARLARVLALHTADIAMLAAFAGRPGHRLIILPGNHDAALLLPGPRAALKTAFLAVPGANVRVDGPGANLIVDEDGSWLTEDGALLVEHGHQADPANRFRRWPAPWEPHGPDRRLERPWGEWFVLDLFNGLEKRWPTVDNTTNDVAAATWLSDHVTWTENLAVALTLSRIGKSAEQKADIAGKSTDSVVWDIPTTRARKDRLLWEMRDVSTRAPTPPEGDTIVDTLTDTDLAEICGEYAASHPDDPDVCVRIKAGTAAKVADELTNGVTGASAKRLGEYLAQRATQLGLTAPNAHPYAYVYGHTHAALNKVAAIGSPFTVILNDGAFQRVVEVDRLKQLAGDGTIANLADLRPEGLPACYSFVEVKPYSSHTPVPRGYYWHQGADGWQRTSYTWRPEACPRG